MLSKYVWLYLSCSNHSRSNKLLYLCPLVFHSILENGIFNESALAIFAMMMLIVCIGSWFAQGFVLRNLIIIHVIDFVTYICVLVRPQQSFSSFNLWRSRTFTTMNIEHKHIDTHNATWILYIYTDTLCVLRYQKKMIKDIGASPLNHIHWLHLLCSTLIVPAKVGSETALFDNDNNNRKRSKQYQSKMHSHISLYNIEHRGKKGE